MTFRESVADHTALDPRRSPWGTARKRPPAAPPEPADDRPSGAARRRIARLPRALDAESSADLRRRRTRELTDLVLTRAEHLAPEDRALVEAIYDRGMRVRALAHLRGEPVRSVRRKVRAIVVRMMSPRFEFVIRESKSWTPTRRRIAIACILHGKTLREASDSLHISLHLVRRHMDAVNVLADARGA